MKRTKGGWKGFKIGIQYNDNDNDHLFVCFGNGIIDPTYIVIVITRPLIEVVRAGVVII